MKQNTTRNSLKVTRKTKLDKRPTKFPLIYKNISRAGTIHPGIFRGRTFWTDSVSPRATTIASREQFKPITVGENLVVNYNHRQKTVAREQLFKRKIYLIFVFKVQNIVGFALQSFRVSTKTIRLLALVDYSLIENLGLQSNCFIGGACVGNQIARQSVTE